VRGTTLRFILQIINICPLPPPLDENSRLRNRIQSFYFIVPNPGSYYRSGKVLVLARSYVLTMIKNLIRMIELCSSYCYRWPCRRVQLL